MMLALLILPLEVFAASNNFKVIDESLKNQVLRYAGVSESDVNLYAEIFKAIDEGNFDKADALKRNLKTTALNGHVAAKKYLHKDYKSSYEELQSWLKKYPYLPQYPAIKNLAVTKAPGYKAPKPQTDEKKLYASYSWYKDKYSKLSPKDRQFVRQNLDEFLISIRKTKHDRAVKILNDVRFKKLVPTKNYDAMCATLASAYFLEGDNKEALKWSKQPILRSKDATACWFGGLAAWKEKNYTLAADYFGKLANLENNDDWLVAAGAYWAYRANMKLKRPDEATKNLRIATDYPRTFYGILAEYMLTGKVDYDWSAKSYFNQMADKKYAKEILSSPTMRRGILLILAGQEDLAAQDWRYNYNKLNISQKELLLYLSHQFNLPNLSFITASRLKNYSKGREYNIFLYPYPDWEPTQGWNVNPAWIWALVRQESLFMPVIRSHAGACGLMQLMPATAAQVSGNNSYRTDWRQLYDKQTNIDIGQDYVSNLREKDFIGDNLIFLAAAYNGGPHNLKKWINNLDYDDDPLLFMEMIPWKETRLYVKRVITNYWMYSSQMGQNAQSLQQLLAGKWPLLDNHFFLKDEAKLAHKKN